jgi:phosphoribosylaminoimidazolecarboxamide formyltransferase/IMP cyclohydrolase
MFKRALVSTSDKSGLIELLKPLADKGCEIVSTGGTSQFLRENGVKVVEVAEVTGFPEVMDG